MCFPSINALYPLRIIGLNQDQKTSGGAAGLTFQLMTPIGQGAIASNDICTNDSSLWINDNNGLISTVNSSVSKFSSNVQGAIVRVDKRFGIDDAIFGTKALSMFSPSAGELISGYAKDGFGADDYSQTYLFYQGSTYGDDRLKLGYFYRTRTSMNLEGRYISRVFSTDAGAWGWAYYGYPEGYIPLNNVRFIGCFCF